MPSSPQSRFQEVANNWFSAMNNYYNDMAACQTAEQAKAIEDNYHRAERAYLDALEQGLTANGPDVEATLADLKTANAAVTEARKNSDSAAKLLTKAKNATGAATRLVRVAAA